VSDAIGLQKVAPRHLLANKIQEVRMGNRQK
jgi:hypothetical protein